ncbi:MAG: UDP-N-acetylmuramate--L-alanine ligase [Bdellovibrionales bacterium GWA2_49_15]|nr:MAG: UDP-N-acetylmuramate--L-alanine ligase [Bdellovibrionales bacterium GWA2_49_15]
MILNKNLTVHFVGIGGIGISAIAEILLDFGFKVSGSDIASGANVDKLKSRGVAIFIGHDAENIRGANLVVHSSAVDKNNVELQSARLLNIPVLNRAEILSDIMMLKKGLAIAGAHGKTTTTSMIATILVESGLDPSYIIGGIVKNLHGHAKVGKGDYLVVEADESDGTFLEISPLLSIITNIDNDHLDYYGSQSALDDAFFKFANMVPFYGLAILNGDDQKLLAFKDKMKKPYIYYGINPEQRAQYNYFAHEIKHGPEGSSYTLLVDNQTTYRVSLAVNGKHNVQNSLAALALCCKLGVPIFDAIKMIKKFTGVGRRLEPIYASTDIAVFDDYAHHPTEINASIEALRAMYPSKKIKLFFEPHRFTRTRDCWNQYLHCFNGVDELCLLPIYPASEQPIAGITAEGLCVDINRIHGSFSILVDKFSEVFTKAILAKEAPIIVVMGAGSIGKKAREAIKAL